DENLGKEVLKFVPWALTGTAGRGAPNDMPRIAVSDYNLFHSANKPNGPVFTSNSSSITLTEWRGAGYNNNDSHSLVSSNNPQFANAAIHDYSLSAGSPAYTIGFEDIDASKIGLTSSFEYEVSPATTELPKRGLLQVAEK